MQKVATVSHGHYFSDVDSFPYTRLIQWTEIGLNEKNTTYELILSHHRTKVKPHVYDTNDF